MITAKNYAAQAEFGMFRAAEIRRKQGADADAFSIQRIADKIGKAIHFALPDGGKILDDGLKGIWGIGVRLPFKSITVEYYVEDKDLPEGMVNIKKRCILAEEILISEALERGHVNEKLALRFRGKDQKNETINAVTSMIYFDGGWYPEPIGFLLPVEWDNLPTMEDTIIGAGNGVPISGYPFAVVPDMCHKFIEEEGREVFLMSRVKDIQTEVYTILEMCEALSCKNITTENHQDPSPKNARRIAKGKLPIYETKILVVSVAKPQTNVGAGAGHSSPRQHLRRGHIRRLPIGNIWVNSCVVGDAKKGIIGKSYAVRKAA